MSQAKVDRYKAAKANRKEIMRKEKMKKMLHRCVTAVVCAAVVGWFGYSVYGTYEANKPKESVEIDYSAINDFTSSLTETAE